MSQELLKDENHGLRKRFAEILPPKALFTVAIMATTATWLMLLIGGTVNPTGSSLACEDWAFHWGLASKYVALPLLGLGLLIAFSGRARQTLGVTIASLGVVLLAADFIPICNGDPLPAMTGGVLYEHGHRLWGWGVGVLTIITMLGAWLSPNVSKQTRLFTILALFLVICQGALGGITVLLGLNPYISTGHLILGYGYLALLLKITWMLVPARRRNPSQGQIFPRTLPLIAFLFAFMQILLGGIIRHFGAGMICGQDPIGCAFGGLWPEQTLQQLHMVHRYFGYLTLAIVLWAVVASRKHLIEAERKHMLPLVWIIIATVILQVLLGIFTVMTGKVVWIVTLHTAFGGLLFASLAALWLSFGPLGDRSQKHAPNAPNSTR